MPYEFYLEGLSVGRAADRLMRGGVEVLSARKTAKNGLVVRVAANDRKKAFAILQGSCYNIKKFRPRGAQAALFRLKRSLGLVAGTLAALVLVFAMQGRVLRVAVTGSGAYLEPQIRAILAEAGVGLFSDMPEENALVPQILALPRVHFCAVRQSGGVLTVRVETADEISPLSPAPLLSPAAGRIEELVVIRGTALCAAGDDVERGQTLVAPTDGESGAQGFVVARVVVAYPVSALYEMGEEGALLQAELDFGRLSDVHTTETERGTLVEGTAHAEGECNFG